METVIDLGWWVIVAMSIAFCSVGFYLSRRTDNNKLQERAIKALAWGKEQEKNPVYKIELTTTSNQTLFTTSYPVVQDDMVFTGWTSEDLTLFKLKESFKDGFFITQDNLYIPINQVKCARIVGTK